MKAIFSILCFIYLGSSTTNFSKTIILSKDKVSQWTIFTDVILGGESSAKMKQQKNGLFTFFGRTSFENNGPIAQVISPKIEANINDYKGIMIKYKTDQSNYILSLQEERFSSYGQHFEFQLETKENEWVEMKIPFSKFSGAYYGVPTMDTHLDREKIKFISFIRTNQTGTFELKIEEIRLYE